jgi:hypothetical protein
MATASRLQGQIWELSDQRVGAAGLAGDVVADMDDARGQWLGG